jgi:hypothetical protein
MILDIMSLKLQLRIEIFIAPNQREQAFVSGSIVRACHRTNMQKCDCINNRFDYVAFFLTI